MNNEKQVKKNISDILFKALTQKSKITKEQDKKIKNDIGNELSKLN